MLRNYPALRDLFGRLGWPLYADRDLVRLFKTPPARLGAFAAGGPGPQTLQWFFLLVAGAETLGRKVSLGALVGAARTAAADAGVASSGSQPERRAIVGAIRMLTQRGVIVEVDGDVEDYLHDEDPQVLIEVHHAALAPRDRPLRCGRPGERPRGMAGDGDPRARRGPAHETAPSRRHRGAHGGPRRRRSRLDEPARPYRRRRPAGRSVRPAP